MLNARSTIALLATPNATGFASECGFFSLDCLPRAVEILAEKGPVTSDLVS